MRGQEAAAANIPTAGIDHGLGIAHRDGGIDRIAALAKHFSASLRRQALGGHDKAGCRFSWWQGRGVSSVRQQAQGQHTAANA